MNINDNTLSNSTVQQIPELSKREYFAALALQGIISNRTFANFGDDQLSYIDAGDNAVLYADALINALKADPSFAD